MEAVARRVIFVVNRDASISSCRSDLISFFSRGGHSRTRDYDWRDAPDEDGHVFFGP